MSRYAGHFDCSGVLELMILSQYLHENLGALSIKLTPEEVAEVRAAEAETHEIGRNPAGFEAFHFIDTPALNA